MTIGIILVVAGLMIALFPALLSVIVAFILISVGASICAMSYRLRKTNQRFGNGPFMDFFTKY